MPINALILYACLFSNSRNYHTLKKKSCSKRLVLLCAIHAPCKGPNFFLILMVHPCLEMYLSFNFCHENIIIVFSFTYWEIHQSKHFQIQNTPR